MRSITARGPRHLKIIKEVSKVELAITQVGVGVDTIKRENAMNEVAVNCWGTQGVKLKKEIERKLSHSRRPAHRKSWQNTMASDISRPREIYSTSSCMLGCT